MANPTNQAGRESIAWMAGKGAPKVAARERRRRPDGGLKLKEEEKKKTFRLLSLPDQSWRNEQARPPAGKRSIESSVLQ